MAQALVTGATSGIGRAIAIARRDGGHDVVALGRQAGALADLGTMGIRGLRVDLTDRAALTSAVAGLESDVVVNNAGLMPPMVPFCDLPEDEVDRAVSVT